ncbi:MAG: TlpA disulfide reductase family protein [Pseudomonadota bacterium]
MRIIGTLLLILSFSVFASAPKESVDTLNETFPDLNFITPDGDSAAISDYRGKVVLVKLWATWCGRCRAEWPQHQALYDKVKADSDVEIITLQVFEEPEVSEAWADTQGYDVPLFVNPVTDRGALETKDGSLFFVKGTPMVFLIDKDGTLRKKSVGGNGKINESDVRQWL